ncbi:hypothetical protein GCM10010840_13250 [Deinococcus aerolatus]|uniref:Tetracyclin repressor-like C-terminal group 31 domain-containing protein n=2 Tax=Deinococcus aerolatus TaxID=522487 RepID=A0ABQ2G5G3_9DEIO|nr:hypothetical protein GCM10010840_13250 [Deinococcus aerolatus]
MRLAQAAKYGHPAPAFPRARCGPRRARGRVFERLAPSPDVAEHVGALPPTLQQATASVQDFVTRTTRQPELTPALFELRLKAARRPGLAQVLSVTLDRNYALNTGFHLQARLPGGAPEGALLHYAVDGLLLDVLTVSINGCRHTDQVVSKLVRRLLGGAQADQPPS